MNRSAVHVAVDPAYRRAVPAVLLRRWARAALQYLGLAANTGLDIAITDDARVRELNRSYRGLGEATDVLSFPYQDQAVPAPYYGEAPPPATSPPTGRAGPQAFVVPPREATLLGEVVIAFPYAQRQAQIAGHSVQDEIKLLLVHGILHLLGYDHMEPEDERRMDEKTNELLARLANLDA